jgi:predicted ATPase
MVDLLIKVFEAAGQTFPHPLVFFFDDIQWADTSSWQFFSALVGRKDIRALILFSETTADGELKSS